MGWASRYAKIHCDFWGNVLKLYFLFYSGDPLSNMVLTFDTMEEAIAYAVKNGT